MISSNLRHIATLTLAVVLSAASLTSCNNYLTDEPKSQLSPDEAYNSVAKLKNNALLTIYNYIGSNQKYEGLQGMDRGIYDLNSLTTDEQIIPTRGGDWYDEGLWQRLFLHTWTPGEASFSNTWNYLYKVIILCNEGIEHIDAYRTSDEEEVRTLLKYKSELRALRAMFYFYLMDLYGRVPLVTTTDVKSSDMQLNPRSDTFYWIYNEFNEALPHLSYSRSTNFDSEYYGRMTILVAYFVMMKLAINAEIYTDDDWTDTQHPDGKDIILKTYDSYTEKTIEANTWDTVKYLHNILKIYFWLSDIYNMNFSVDNEQSPENIFVIPVDPRHFTNRYYYFTRSVHYCHGIALGEVTLNGPCATVSTVKAFGYTLEETYDIDSRFYDNFYFETVYINGKQVFEEDGTTPLYYHPLAVTSINLSSTPFERTAGARIAKYTKGAIEIADDRRGYNDIVLFRYADALLMYAEACYRLGDTEEALKAVNKVYQRSNPGKYETINEDILLTERLKELMWEGWRRNDLIRFHRYHKPYDLKTNVAFEQDAHTTVFPIPANMITMHPTWHQNPGY